MLSLSTSWNYHSGISMKEMLTEIKNIGFDSIELGYKTTSQHFDEIQTLLKSSNLKVTSIHNFCPLPDDGPSDRHPSNYYRLSAIDEEERKKAVEWTHASIDSAAKVGAQAVVIHAGTVEMQNDLSSSLLKMCKNGKKNIDEFHQTLDDLLKSRKKARDPFMDSIIKSLNEIMPYAQDKNIIMGLETRYYPTEMPNYEEIGELLSRFYNQGMLYWHDFGHAEVNSRLEITPHKKYFESYQDKLIGFHIHGVKDLKDHFAPFDGDFDIEEYLGYIGDDHIKVIESHSQATSVELQQAVSRLS